MDVDMVPIKLSILLSDKKPVYRNLPAPSGIVITLLYYCYDTKLIELAHTRNFM